MCPPFGLELTPFTCSEHVPQGPVLRKRPGSAKEKQPGGKGRDLNECWFTPAFPCPSAAERKKSVEAQRRTTSHGRETSVGATSLFRNRLVAPPQASEEEPDHRHLDQCFAGEALFARNPRLNLLLRESHPYVRSTTHQAQAEERNRVFPERVPLPPDPSPPRLGTTQLTPARGRPHLPRSSSGGARRT